jgi:DNA-binding response OmpR family regulator
MDDGLQLARTHRPRVIVVDLDDARDDELATCARYEQECRRQQAALLVLGVARTAASGLDNEQVVSKPYHYGPLIRKIEQLCRRSLETDDRMSPVSG